MNRYALFSDFTAAAPQRRLVAWLLAQLDDSLGFLRARLSDVGVPELRWQLSPGSNTVGMLLAHLAVTEAYWLNVAPLERNTLDGGDSVIRSIVGINTNDDGMPLPPDGKHPPALYSKDWGDYLGMIEKARIRTHEVTACWTDDTLSTTFKHEGQVICNGWVLYHLFEHYCSHLGQILQIRALWRRVQCG